MILTKPDHIKGYHMAAQLSALKLEAMGLRNSRGSVLAFVKRTYNLKGSRQKITAQFAQIYADFLFDNGMATREDSIARAMTLAGL